MPNCPSRTQVLSKSPYCEAAFALHVPIPSQFAHCRKSSDQYAGLCARRLGARSARSAILRGMPISRTNSVIARTVLASRKRTVSFFQSLRLGDGWVSAGNRPAIFPRTLPCPTRLIVIVSPHLAGGFCDAWSLVTVGVWCAQLTCGIRRGARHQAESAGV